MQQLDEIKYVKDKKYTYVISYEYNNEYDNECLDISIFEINEWVELLKISNVFEEAVANINSETDNEYTKIKDHIKESSYYLYYSPFCHFGNFNDLEYNTMLIEDIYKLVFNYIECNTCTDSKHYANITINNFRKWLINNSENITIHHEHILKNLYYKSYT